MDKFFFSRQEIADELGIDPKTLRKRLNEAGFVLKKGLIPAEKVKEIKLRLHVKQQSQDDSVINEPTDENFNKFDRSNPDSQ